MLLVVRGLPCVLRLTLIAGAVGVGQIAIVFIGTLVVALLLSILIPFLVFCLLVLFGL